MCAWPTALLILLYTKVQDLFCHNTDAMFFKEKKQQNNDATSAETLLFWQRYLYVEKQVHLAT